MNRIRRFSSTKSPWCVVVGLASLACSQPLKLGDDIVWSANQEAGSLDAWTANDSGGVRLPTEDCQAQISSAFAHRGEHSLELVNPANWERKDEGPSLFHSVGAQPDAYYSAWFLLPEQYHIDPWLTIMQLSSRDDAKDALHSPELLQLRSLPSGGYVLQVFNNNSASLLEALADPPPFVQPGQWFQVEARLEPRNGGRLRVWLDGRLVYDLGNRPGATGAEQVLVVSNLAESSKPAPLVLYVDDAAVSLSRVSPHGSLGEE